MLRLAQPEDCPSQGRLPPRHRRQQVRHDTDVNSALQNLKLCYIHIHDYFASAPFCGCRPRPRGDHVCRIPRSLCSLR